MAGRFGRETEKYHIGFDTLSKVIRNFQNNNNSFYIVILLGMARAFRVTYKIIASVILQIIISYSTLEDYSCKFPAVIKRIRNANTIS